MSMKRRDSRQICDLVLIIIQGEDYVSLGYYFCRYRIVSKFLGLRRCRRLISKLCVYFIGIGGDFIYRRICKPPYVVGS